MIINLSGLNKIFLEKTIRKHIFLILTLKLINLKYCSLVESISYLILHYCVAFKNTIIVYNVR